MIRHRSGKITIQVGNTVQTTKRTIQSLWLSIQKVRVFARALPSCRLTAIVVVAEIQAIQAMTGGSLSLPVGNVPMAPGGFPPAGLPPGMPPALPMGMPLPAGMPLPSGMPMPMSLPPGMPPLVPGMPMPPPDANSAAFAMPPPGLAMPALDNPSGQFPIDDDDDVDDKNNVNVNASAGSDIVPGLQAIQQPDVPGL